MEPSDETRIPGTRAGEQVGLGRVVEDRRSTGSPDREDPGGPDDPLVEQASEDSFPASDPPTFNADTATPDRADRIEPPAGNDVP
jgi:hypothetical protein